MARRQQTDVDALAQHLRALAGARDVGVALRALRRKTGGIWGPVLFDLNRWSVKQAGHLDKLLRACQARAAAANLRYALRLFAPFWDSIPVEMAQVSYKSVYWQLLPAGPLVPQGDIEFCQLDDTDLLGDFLFAHLAINERLQQGLSRPGSDVEAEFACPAVGGLRFADVLKSYLSLVAPFRPRSNVTVANRFGSGWLDRGLWWPGRGSGDKRVPLETVQRLIHANPLTQLVYLDIAAHGRVACRGTAFPEMPSQGLRRVLCPTDAPRWWCNLWISHLARSLLATVIGPVYDSRRAAEERLARLELLAAVFGCAEARLLQARFLDLLVRHLASRHSVELTATWHSCRGADAVRRDRTLLSTDSPLCREFVRVLTGCTMKELADHIHQTNQESADRRLNAMVAQLITVCEPQLAYTGQASQADQETSFLKEQVAELFSRLCDDRQFGIELPGAGKTLAPGTLLSAWIPELVAPFSSSGSSTVEEPVEEWGNTEE